jgi:hypothetical protein
MLLLLIACTCLVYLSLHAPGLFAVFLGLGALWLLYAVPVALGLGLSAFVNALPDWRWLREPAPKPAPEIGPLATRSDLLAVPCLLGVAALVVWLLSLAPA